MLTFICLPLLWHTWKIIPHPKPKGVSNEDEVKAFSYANTSWLDFKPSFDVSLLRSLFSTSCSWVIIAHKDSLKNQIRKGEHIGLHSLNITPNLFLLKRSYISVCGSVKKCHRRANSLLWTVVVPFSADVTLEWEHIYFVSQRLIWENNDKKIKSERKRSGKRVLEFAQTNNTEDRIEKIADPTEKQTSCKTKTATWI